MLVMTGHDNTWSGDHSNTTNCAKSSKKTFVFWHMMSHTFGLYTSAHLSQCWMKGMKYGCHNWNKHVTIGPYKSWKQTNVFLLLHHHIIMWWYTLLLGYILTLFLSTYHHTVILEVIVLQYIKDSITEFSLALTTYNDPGVYVVLSRCQYFALFATEFSLL